LRVVYIPTVHLSVPENLYRELRSRAEELGIQITDLIKMYIVMGLRKEFNINAADLSNSRDILSSKIVYIEGRLAQISRLIENLIGKVSELEERIEELESPDIISEVVRSRRKG
jgi:hypothetical protein